MSSKSTKKNPIHLQLLQIALADPQITCYASQWMPGCKANTATVEETSSGTRFKQQKEEGEEE